MTTIITKTGLVTGITQFSDYLAAPATAHPIHIVSGEGEEGTVEVYNGTRTARAIKMRLTRERCGGDRWARAVMYMHTADDGADIGMDCTDGTVGYFPSLDES